MWASTKPYSRSGNVVWSPNLAEALAQQERNLNMNWSANPYISLTPPRDPSLLPALEHSGAEREGPKTERSLKIGDPQRVSLYSTTLNWTNKEFAARKLPFHHVERWLSATSKMRIELSQELAKQLWERTLRTAHLMHHRDCMLQPKTRDLCFPSSPEMAQNFAVRGFVPLAPGDSYRYSVLRLQGTEHCGVYLGRGFGGHFVVDRTSKDLGEVGLVLVEDLRLMFTRGELKITRHEECATQLDRAEVIRRVLSTAVDPDCKGCYRYSVVNFNCQNALMSWRDEPPPEDTWGEVLIWVSVALIAALLIVMIVLVCLLPFQRTVAVETVTFTQTTEPSSAPPQISSRPALTEPGISIPAL